MVWILSNGVLCNISFPCVLGKMTLRENSIFESWENRKLHDPQEKNEIPVMVELERPWPTGEKWNPGHGNPGKAMTYRRKMRSRPWETRKDHDLQKKNKIQVMEEQGIPWPTSGKWNPDHGETRKTMTYRRIMKFRSWGNREDHDLQDRSGNRIRRFCLFRINLYKINHARRNLTFTCKITPRVIFLYLLCSKFLACIRYEFLKCTDTGFTRRFHR